MSLGELIELLKQQPQDKIVKNGFGKPRSYRGYYEQLAFEPEQNVAIASMLEHAKDAVGRKFVGYKGGTYRMNHHTPVHIAKWGECNFEEDDITIERFNCMMND